jgi:hypothetical protein
MYRVEIEFGRNLSDEFLCGSAFVSVIAKKLEPARRYDICFGNYEKEWELTKLDFLLKGTLFAFTHLTFYVVSILGKTDPLK